MTGGGAHSSGIEDIFYSDWDSVQEPAKITRHRLVAKQLCLAQRAFSINHHPGLKVRFEAVDLFEARFEQLQRRQRAGSNPPNGFAQSHQTGFSHGPTLPE